MDFTNAEIGMRIRIVRKERGYTREQLAEYADMSSNFLGAVETGKKSMKVQNLAKIAKALDVTADYLIYGTAPYKENVKINTMLSSMSEDKRKQVEKMITVFMETFRIYEKELQEKTEE